MGFRLKFRSGLGIGRAAKRVWKGIFQPIEKAGKQLLSPFRQGKEMAKAMEDQAKREEQWRDDARRRQDELDAINDKRKKQEDQIADERRRTEQMKNNLDDQDKNLTDKKTEYNGGSGNSGSGVLINEEELKRNQGNAQNNGGNLDDYRERLKRMMMKK